MIKAKDLMKWFGATLAVDHVSFQVQPGEILGFLGPNGAGKSTTMRMITGFLPCSGGQVEIGGHAMESDGIAARELIGYLPENAPAYPEMTTIDFLDFVAEIRGLRGREKKAAIDRVIETCNLERVLGKPIDNLSKGFRHRTCFAQCMVHDPPVLVLDEPTDGLDPNQKHEVRELISRMGREEKKTIILSTHILEEVDAVCSRVIIIDKGKLVFNGSPDDLRNRSDLAGAVSLLIREKDPDSIRTVLGNVPDVDRVEILETAPDDKCVRARAYPKRHNDQPKPIAAAVSKQLLEAGITCDEMHTEQGRMDEVFRKITSTETGEEESE